MIVRVVRNGRGTLLVEWQEADELHRGWIPDDMISPDLDVPIKTLRESAPYGVPFDIMLQPVTVSPSVLSEALHRRGIWTEEDLMKNPTAVQHAIIASVEMSVSKLQSQVRMFTLEEEQPKEQDTPKENVENKGKSAKGRKEDLANGGHD